MNSNDATEATVSSHDQPSPANPFATAHFSTFEDLSSRLVLLPFNDNSCTGAKVCSHVIYVESSSRGKSSQQTECTSTSIGKNRIDNEFKETGSVISKGIPRTGCETETSGNDCIGNDAAKESNTKDKVGGKKNKRGKKKLKNKQPCALNVNGNTPLGEADVGQKTDESSVNGQSQTHTTPSSKVACFEQVIPIGYVLVKLNGQIACAEQFVEELDEMDFTDILSLLRSVSYPISLSFTSPENYFKDKDGNEIICSRPSCDENNPAFDYDSQEESEEISSNCSEEQNNHSILASREDAAKFAAQAATELRGRLTRWGFQAATKAAEAACAVQEMREERQRKLMEEQSNKSKLFVTNPELEGETSTSSNKPTERITCKKSTSTANDEDYNGLHCINNSGSISHSNSIHDITKIEDIDLCHLFLQCPSGFVQLDKLSAQKGASSSTFLFSPQKQSTISLTNMSVITVRLSEEKACPVGKNAYKFQWFRSKNLFIKDSEPSSIEWCPLSGATYAAYQPSVSDVGYLLSCVVEFGEDDNSSQRCTSPLPVTIDPSLFESAKTTLLKRSSDNSALFTSLREDATGNIFRLRILVEIADESDSIASSSVIIDQSIDGSFLPLHDKPLQLTHVKARANPSLPRSFELVFAPLSESTLSMMLQSSNNRLQLYAPNRNARESLLVALGFASFTGPLSSLTAETALMPNSSNMDVPALESLGQTKDLSATNTLHTVDLRAAHAKNLYTIQLETQVNEMRAEVEAKAALITKIQHKLNALSDDKKKIEKELNSARSKTEVLSKCEQEVKEKDRVINEQERTMKSLKNEMAVLVATVELRDGKIDAQSEQIKEIQKNLTDVIRKAEEERKLGADEMRAKLEADIARREAESAAVIAEMKKGECQVHEELKLAQSVIKDLNQKYACIKDSACKSKDEIEIMRSEIKKLKMERNSLKNKADGLSKEMSKVSNQSVNKAEIRTLVQTIKQLQFHNSQLQNEVTSLKSEKRQIEEELQVTRLAHRQSANYIADHQPVNGNVQRAIKQCHELERVISNLTEHLDAKEMQICTLKQINEALSKEIDEIKATRK